QIVARIPPGETFILVDQDQYGAGDVIQGRRRMHFPEQKGQYAGLPLDDATAIRELERLRQSGANFMVFAWPARWWLEYYTGLHRHLHAEGRCVLANDRLMIFDLRRGAGTTNGLCKG